MIAGTAVTGVTQTITATVTSVGTYSISTTANGVTFTGSGTFVGTGNQNVVLNATGTPTLAPAFPHTFTYTLNTTPNCNFTRIVLSADDVASSTGRVWMDRNLGASQVASSSTDVASYGHLYQWGRRSDGHQIRTSGTSSTFSTTDVPGNGNFILTFGNDWRSPQNNNLWQGVSGTNNPCPSGYRLPTETELNDERLIFSTQNGAGAFASPLKLMMAGFRRETNGLIFDVGSYGGYWSSTVSGTNARYLLFASSEASMHAFYRAFGFSVRCLKD
jgi:uncharacterized protein (TIGR02145 family)